jgi:hypothetical protein
VLTLIRILLQVGASLAKSKSLPAGKMKSNVVPRRYYLPMRTAKTRM